ncbi:MAG: hypothetical protein WEA56_02055 [Balneolaceae bacterium]
MSFTPVKGMKMIGIIFLVYALLVAPHEGEFWPFSIYPMFSQAGNPWTRAMVIDVTDLPDEELWQTRSLSELQTPSVPVKQYGVDQIDFSNFVSKTQNWTEPRKEALKTMFGRENIRGRRWMTARVHGKIVGRDSVVVEIVPFLMLTADSVYTNPHKDISDYQSGGTL